nr:hypothetical protein [Lysobacter enzymogenes]
MGYFLACVQPYLIGLSELVVAAAVATVLCAFAARVAARASALRLGKAAAARLAWPAAAAVAALFVYALWIRPHLPPYALIESRLVPQLNGQRDYREASLSNVAAYLSWPVVLAAGLGAALAVRAMLARQLSQRGPGSWRSCWCRPWSTCGGRWCRPTISGPRGSGCRRCSRPSSCWPRSLSPAWAGACRGPAPRRAAALALALGGHLLWQQRDTLRLREDAGMLAQIGAIAAQLPSDRRTYVLGQPQLASALLNGFGVPAVQPPPETWNDPARFCPAHGECWVVHHPTVQPIAVAGAVAVADLPLRRLRRVTSVEPLAHGTYQEAGLWRVTRIAR